MKKIFCLVIVGMAVIGCSTNSNPSELESVWKITSDSTAIWVGNEINVGGAFSNSFDKDSTLISIEAYSEINRVVISVIYGSISRTLVTVVDSLNMYSRPLTTGLLALDERNGRCSGSGCETVFSYTLYKGSVAMNGDVNCGESASKLDEFEIIYETKGKVFVTVKFESTGMEETIKKLTCR